MIARDKSRVKGSSLSKSSAVRHCVCHVTRVTPENEWAGAQLRARRLEAGKTQKEVADLSGIDRSRYNGLEAGRYAITPTYAERLAQVFTGVSAEAFLPPAAMDGQADRQQSPLDLLHELAATVDDLLETIDDLKSQVASLQHRPAAKRRGTARS
jgi:transcriptional regulator with XRE-family HTH domain